MPNFNPILRNRNAVVGLTVTATIMLVAIFADQIAPYSATRIFTGMYHLPPGSTDPNGHSFLLGTDDIGRDVFSRIIVGTRVSVAIGLIVVAVALSLGCILGFIAGYFGGWLEQLILRCNDLLMTLPSVLLAIVIASALGPSITTTIVAVAVVSIPSFLRLARTTVLQEKHKIYLHAAQLLGMGHFRLLTKQLLPNCRGPIIVQATIAFSEAILSAAALGFLGLGAQPPIPEWGTMLADARGFLFSYPHLITVPGLCILVTVLGFNLAGDGVRDILDPKHQSSRT